MKQEYYIQYIYKVDCDGGWRGYLMVHMTNRSIIGNIRGEKKNAKFYKEDEAVIIFFFSERTIWDHL